METKTVFDKEDVGLFFDHSADSADSLNLRIVNAANHYGANIELPKEGKDYSEMLSYAGDEALEYFNTLCSDDVYFTFEDNCLFLREIEEEN